MIIEKYKNLGYKASKKKKKKKKKKNIKIKNKKHQKKKKKKKRKKENHLLSSWSAITTFNILAYNQSLSFFSMHAYAQFI